MHYICTLFSECKYLSIFLAATTAQEEGPSLCMHVHSVFVKNAIQGKAVPGSDIILCSLVLPR